MKRLEEQKGRLDGLDALKEALVQSMQSKTESNSSKSVVGKEEDKKEGHRLKSNRSKQSLAQKELPHLNLVLQHPVFNDNPFATMQEHLKNSFTKQAEELEVLATQEREEESKKTREKKEARKERIRNSKYEKGRKQNKRGRR